MKNLRKLKTLETNAPEAMKAFSAFDKAARFGDAIPRKYKEPMKLAATFTTQRPTASKSTWARRGKWSTRLGQPPVVYSQVIVHISTGTTLRRSYVNQGQTIRSKPEISHARCIHREIIWNENVRKADLPSS